MLRINVLRQNNCTRKFCIDEMYYDNRSQWMVAINGFTSSFYSLSEKEEARFNFELTKVKTERR